MAFTASSISTLNDKVYKSEAILGIYVARIYFTEASPSNQIPSPYVNGAKVYLQGHVGSTSLTDCSSGWYDNPGRPLRDRRCIVLSPTSVSA
ncbi:hypothetical protein GW17_00048598 [Ensete ventricosum]|nr:hypothetical protein GW17_00048598 [Ensete ventricosum]